MKNLYLILLLALVTINCSTTGHLNLVVYDEEAEQEILLGNCNRKALQKEQFCTWFNEEYANYEVDKTTISAISTQKLNTINITLVMATWCGDSRREVPRLYKILDQLNYNEKQIKFIAVDRAKKVESVNISSLNIEYVPTIIFYSGEKELGRIIESPEETLEKDILKFVLQLGSS